MSEQLYKNKNLSENDIDAQVPEFADFDTQAPDVDAIFDMHKSQIGHSEKLTAMAAMGEGMQIGHGRHRKEYNPMQDAQQNLQIAVGAESGNPRHKERFDLTAHYQGEDAGENSENILDKTGAEIRSLRLDKAAFRSQVQLPEGWSLRAEDGRLSVTDDEGKVRGEEISDSLSNVAEAAALRQITIKAFAQEARTGRQGAQPGAEKPTEPAPTPAPEASATQSEADQAGNLPKVSRPRRRHAAPRRGEQAARRATVATNAASTEARATRSAPMLGEGGETAEAPSFNNPRPFPDVGERSFTPDEVMGKPVVAGTVRLAGLGTDSAPATPARGVDEGDSNTAVPGHFAHLFRGGEEAPLPTRIPEASTTNGDPDYGTAHSGRGFLYDQLRGGDDEASSVDVAAPGEADSPERNAVDEAVANLNGKKVSVDYVNDPDKGLMIYALNRVTGETVTVSVSQLTDPEYFKDSMDALTSMAEAVTTRRQKVARAVGRVASRTLGFVGLDYTEGKQQSLDARRARMEAGEGVVVDMSAEGEAFNGNRTRLDQRIAERDARRAARLEDRYGGHHARELERQTRGSFMSRHGSKLVLGATGLAMVGGLASSSSQPIGEQAPNIVPGISASPNPGAIQGGNTQSPSSTPSASESTSPSISESPSSSASAAPETPSASTSSPSATATPEAPAPSSPATLNPNRPDAPEPGQGGTGNTGGNTARTEAHDGELLTFSADGKTVSAKLRPGGSILGAAADANINATAAANAVVQAGITDQQARSLQPGQIVDFTQTGTNTYTVRLR